MMDLYDGFGWGAVIVMCTLMVVVLAAGAAWLMATLRDRQQPDARRALDARLARGGISEEQYLSTISLLDH